MISTTPNESKSTTTEILTTKAELLLLVYIHGFKGTDESFRKFPERLEHMLSETIPDVIVESRVFPAYETKGDLTKAVVRFADWLTTLTVEREVASGLGAGKAKIVLCGHSMGGLLAADTLRGFVTSCQDRDPLWPKIIACIGYDTPYLGIHPFVVKHGATKASEYIKSATAVGSLLLGSLAGLGAQKATQTQQQTPQAPQSKWGSAMYAVGGAIMAGAVAGGAYYKRDDLTEGLSWATDHMKYVGNLWNEESLKQRVEALIDIEKERGVIFRALYTILPPRFPEFLNSRTFIVLPKYGSRAKDHFLPASNGIALDELQAHIGIFSATTNDGYYQLGLTSVKIIQDALITSREHVTSCPTSLRKKSKSPTKEGQRT